MRGERGDGQLTFAVSVLDFYGLVRIVEPVARAGLRIVPIAGPVAAIVSVVLSPFYFGCCGEN